MLSFRTWIGEDTSLCLGAMCNAWVSLITWHYSWNKKGPGIDPRGIPDVTLSEFHIWDKDISALQVDPQLVEKWAREADPLFHSAMVIVRGHAGSSVQCYFTHWCYSEKLVLNLGRWILSKYDRWNHQHTYTPKKKYHYNSHNKNAWI